MSKKVTIVIPIWNTPVKWLDLAVRSIEVQTYELNKIELCIYDDGSDNIYKLQYDRWLQKNPRKVEIKWSSSRKNMGLAFAKNIAASLGDGEFIIPLDSDDFLHPDAVQRCTEILENRKSVQLVYSDNIKFKWPTLEISQYRKKSLYQKYHEKYKGSVFDPVLQSSFIVGIQAFRRETFESLNGFKSELLVGEDVEFITRVNLLETKCNFFHIPLVLYFRRHHDRSLSRRMQKNMWNNTEKVFTEASKNIGLKIQEVRYFDRIGPYFVSHYLMISNDGRTIIPPYLDLRKKWLIESEDTMESLNSEAIDIINYLQSLINLQGDN